GVLAKVTGILASTDINIDAVLQREADEVSGEGAGPNGTRSIPQTDLIILTHDCEESRMNQAIALMQSLPTVLAPITRIRKEELA
ncbi:MAG: ACT domain-containing protein, partial [Candidatus Saccharibacteria bacterium]|nr:ACT domain-containing protein [Rhodoferax sp.]